ncbi:MAG: hypothetical protein H6861_04665 [Rhodospirillales bacterium]|nr:hypothetical protein [Rhodospirillales bacterium]
MTGDSFGYNRAVSDVGSLARAFGQPASGRSPNAFQTAAKSVFSGNSQTVVAKLTGVDHTKKLPQIQSSDKAGQNATANVSAAVSADQKMEKVQNVQAGFKTAVEEMQKPIREAMNQAVDNIPEINHGSAHASFDADSPTTAADVMFDAATMKAGIPAVKAMNTASNVASAIGDAKAIAGKLTPAQEARLADEMRSLLSPKVDSLSGEVLEPPVVASNLNVDVLKDMPDAELIQTFKQALLPPENQPEWAIMEGVKEELKQDLGHHGSIRNVNEAVIADAETVGIKTENVSIAQQDMIDRMTCVQGSLTDGGFLGMLSQSEIKVSPEMAMYARKTAGMPSIDRESPSIDQNLEAELVRSAQYNIVI